MTVMRAGSKLVSNLTAGAGASQLLAFGPLPPGWMYKRLLLNVMDPIPNDDGSSVTDYGEIALYGAFSPIVRPELEGNPAAWSAIPKVFADGARILIPKVTRNTVNYEGSDDVDGTWRNNVVPAPVILNYPLLFLEQDLYLLVECRAISSQQLTGSVWVEIDSVR
jgi:hypothetical protein